MSFAENVLEQYQVDFQEVTETHAHKGISSQNLICPTQPLTDMASAVQFVFRPVMCHLSLFVALYSYVLWCTQANVRNTRIKLAMTRHCVCDRKLKIMSAFSH